MKPGGSVIKEKPRQSAESVTKSIRTKANSIETQLHIARELLDGTINTFLPRKQEFVLDWLLDRLKADQKSKRIAELQTGLWTLLRDLWDDVNLDSVTRTSCFRKHNFNVILQDALNDIGNRPLQERAGIMRAVDRALEGILRINSEIKIRPSLDQATHLFGSSLTVVNNLHVDQREVVAKSFSKSCLRSALTLIVLSINARVTETVEKCISDAIFSTENLIDYFNAIEALNLHKNPDAGFTHLLKNMSEEQKEDSFDDITTIPLLLKLGLTALVNSSSKITPDQRSVLGASFLSILDAFSIPSPSPVSESIPLVLYLSNRHLRKLFALLEVFLNNAPPASDELSATLTTIATTGISFLDFNDADITSLAWNVLALIMKIDFDVILGLMNQLRPRLQHATADFLQVVVTTNFKIRNGVEFIKEWSEMLNDIDDESELQREDLVKLISNEIRVNLSASQILELLKFMDERLSNPNTLLPLKAILSAIKSHQIIEHVSSFIKTSFENNLNEKLRAKDPSEELFEIYFLAMELSDSLAITLYDAKVIKRAAKLCKKSGRLFPLQCILRQKEVGRPIEKGSNKAEKIISKAFRRGLMETFEVLVEETQSSPADGVSLAVVAALIKRWILLICNVPVESLRNNFVRIICNLGSSYNPSRSHSDNTTASIRCAELQLRFLMSSDVYEKVGLVDPLIDVLGEDLELTPPLANGTANTNGDKQAPNKTKIDGIPWSRCRNAVMVVSRMPIEPLPQQRKNEIFHKLLKLDREIVDGIVKLPLQKSERLDFLVTIRQALIRYGNTVSKTVIEAPAIVNELFALYKSLDKSRSYKLCDATIEFGESLLRRIAQSSSNRADEFLTQVVNTTVTKSSYKLQSMRASLLTWLEHPKGTYFIPEGEAALGISVLEELNSVKKRFDDTTLNKFELMRQNTLVQLRDCLTDLFEAKAPNCGVYQATYLLESLRRLLLDENTKMDLEGLLSRLGSAFTLGVKMANTSDNEHQALIVKSLAEIFQIMCFKDAFDSPVVLCAVYISLLKLHHNELSTTKIDVCFGRIVSKFDAENYDLVLQELRATSTKDVTAIKALGIVIDTSAEGKDVSFAISKLLFGVTRDMLTATSSSIFIGMLKLVLKILREKPKAVSKWNLDHIIANITIACSPASVDLQGSENQDDIFNAIGLVALTILQLYHKRLTQKYHLVVRMLQVMLHVFINTTPMTSRKLRDNLSRPPPWLSTSCSASSAQLFSRILSMWAAPPSVTWHTTRSQEAKRHLSSTAAKTAKAVSKHIPWFMMEYVALQAEYPDLIMEEPVQKALAPGLYALFGILGTYEREMCMGALDGAGRGIFKNLWEEWSKFGKFVEK